MICMNTATGLLVGFAAHRVDQQTTKRYLEHPFAACGPPQVVESDQGMYFTGHA